tara:strand:+ start:119 stop:442 length:324 start_codon:yes stop_codon:yes gene_type:complete
MNRYQDITILRNENRFVGTIRDKYYKTVEYPEISPSENDIYVQTEFGDRLDLLAFQFYGDVSLYWIIAITNPDKVNFGSLYLSPGSQLAIPRNISGIIDSFNKLNEL